MAFRRAFVLFALYLLAAAQEVRLPELVGDEASVAGRGNSASSKPLVLELEHSVDGGQSFSPRGKFTINLNAEGKYTVSEAEGNSLLADSTAGFKSLLRTNDLYRIRFRSLVANASSPYVSAALPACELQKSGFKEDISVYLGQNKNVVGLSYSSPVIALSRSCDPEKLAVPTVLLSRLKVSQGESSMSVPMQAQGPKPQTLMNVDLGAFMDENLKMHGEKGPQGEQNQSFLRRYVRSNHPTLYNSPEDETHFISVSFLPPSLPPSLSLSIYLSIYLIYLSIYLSSPSFLSSGTLWWRCSSTFS